VASFVEELENTETRRLHRGAESRGSEFNTKDTKNHKATQRMPADLPQRHNDTAEHNAARRKQIGFRGSKHLLEIGLRWI
jgi:hypothetical protein